MTGIAPRANPANIERPAQPVASQLENPQYPMTGAGILDALRVLPSSAGVRVNERTALGMPAVWRSVNIIASGAASLPLHAYRQSAGEDENSIRVQVNTGQAADLLANPHPDLTPFELWELVYAHIALWGNAYLQKLRDQNGRVRELWPLHPSRVKPGRASDLSKVYEIDGDGNTGGQPRTDREILHIPGFGYDGVCGLSPISVARQGIGLALAAEQFGGKLFGSGSMAGGILTTDQRLNQTQADNLKARWKAKVSGLQNAHEIAVLDAGSKFQQLTIPPEDAQFLESRSFQVEEIARIYGVPPHMLMSMEKSTSWGTGIEQQSLGFVTYTLRPWLTRVEQRVTSILKPEPVYAKYSVEGLLRGDSTTRAAFYKEMWGLGAYSTNEIRRLEELEPVDDGDVRYRPLNFGVLGTTDEKNPAKVVTEPGEADAATP